MPRDSSGIPRQCLPREVLKWIQSLDLSFAVKNARRDFANGFLVAEIFSWYYPQDIQMHSYDNGISLPTKLGNWSQLERFFTKKTVDVPKELIDGTIHCKPGAAEWLVQRIYSILTNRVVKTLDSDSMIDFTDEDYQMKIPIHARATASHSIKNNLKITEFMTEPNIITNQEKVHAIMERHFNRRGMERVEDPARFDIKPTLGQLAHRHCPPAQGQVDMLSSVAPAPSGLTYPKQESDESYIGQRGGIKEIEVRQMDKSSQQSIRGMEYQSAPTAV